LGPQQADDQVQPLDLAPRVLEVELGSPSVSLQAPMLLGVEQAIEVETHSPPVLCLQNRLGVIQAYSQDVLGQLAVGACQVPPWWRSADGTLH